MDTDLSQLGLYRTPLGPHATLEERVARNREMLARALNMGTTVAVVGSGLSVPLGYPTWDRFTTEVLELAVANLSGPGKASLVGYLERLRTREVRGSNDLTFYLGECVQQLHREGRLELYHAYVRDRFGAAKVGLRPEDNPHRLLRNLQISRFATTNYDVELERSLEGRDDIDIRALSPVSLSEEQLHDSGQTCSFTQVPADYRALSLFALARVRAARSMVFHLHGRFDDPESIIATEADYQQWYLGEHGGAGLAFRQTIELLFFSNPILFVGYGMGEEDLMRPLRILSEKSPEYKHKRLLFALYPVKAGRESEVGILYQRYGVHVIPFEPPAEHTSDLAWRDAVNHQLRQLNEERKAWRHGWLEKPFIRKVHVGVRSPNPYFHYRLESGTGTLLGPQRTQGQLDRILESAHQPQVRVIVLLGPGGTGKSHTAQRVIDSVAAQASAFDGYFFWSSYYTDEAVTGLERALQYLDPHGSTRGDQLTRFARCLETGRYLIVFDGFERLLRELPGQQAGLPTSGGVRRFLEMLKDTGSRSTVLITSRLWPETLGSMDAPGEWLHVQTMPLMTNADIRDAPPFDQFPPEQVAALVSLLEGHTYALVLAARFLELTAASEGPEAAMARLQAKLSWRPPHSRNAIMIRTLLARITERHGSEVQLLLEHLALFMSPISLQTMEVCFEAAAAGDPSFRPGVSLVDLLDVLLQCDLLFRAQGDSDGIVGEAYTVHPIVRGYVYHMLHGAARETLPNFTLPGFTSGTAVLHPGRGKSVDLVRRCTDALAEAAQTAHAEGRGRDATDLCRALFGVIRSRMEAITVPRWGRYNDYLIELFRVANLARQFSAERWTYAERESRDSVFSHDAPLYSGELAWLYNDIGLGLCGEGHLPDTYAIWEQGYQINRIIEPASKGGQYLVQSLLHMAHTFIELGQLDAARDYLTQTAAQNEHLGDPDYEARITGYQGLIAHLQGNRQAADELYGRAIGLLESQDRNPRAQSWFHFHWANLKRSMERYEDAEESMRTAHSLAEAEEYPDLLAWAYFGMGRLFRARGDHIKARLRYQSALGAARRLGIRKLEADVVCELARLAGDLRDYETARKLAIESLALANELGLGLRQTHGLVVLGVATVQMGQRDLGLEYLRHARSLARLQHYGRLALQAEGLLREFQQPREASPDVAP